MPHQPQRLQAGLQAPSLAPSARDWRYTPEVPPQPDRRQFLSGAAAFALAGPFLQFRERVERGAGAPVADDGYGRPTAARDESTGLTLLEVPEGFRYWSFSWRGERLEDGRITPGAHDGMAAFAAPDGRIRLVRNHELDADIGPFGAAPTYDARGSGGTTTVEFDPVRRSARAWASLCGTLRNCAGGPTPWGSWLTCEETLDEPRSANRFSKPHGYVFEVPAEGQASPEPLKGLGRFVHEAVAIDPATGIVYLTEDHGSAGFYRFVPSTPGRLGAGGRLEMLAISGRARHDTRINQRSGTTFTVHWVPIADPDRAHQADRWGDAQGVSSQGWQRGAAVFARLEGAWYGGGAIYFAATSGGNAGSGQIWEYVPGKESLRLIFESPGPSVLDRPDNLAVSPRGGIALCEDGGGAVQRIHGMTPDGRLFPFIRNRVTLRGERLGYRGDFRDREFAGVCFSPDGQWMFFNIQTPGMTFAVTGPWERGKL
jgi:secreted PhoX family phosphatase